MQITKTWDWDVSVSHISGGVRSLCQTQRQPGQSGSSVRLSLDQTETKQSEGNENRRREGERWSMKIFCFLGEFAGSLPALCPEDAGGRAVSEEFLQSEG